MSNAKPHKIRLGRPGTRRSKEPSGQKPTSPAKHDESDASSTAPGEYDLDNLLYLQLLVQDSDIPAFDLPEKYGVQDSAPRDRRHEDEGFPYLLGSGASCTVVQHETDEDTKKIVPKGTIVALKKYTKVRRYTDLDSISSKVLVNDIWRDLRVLCHPYLNQHENFCRLLYIGWEPYNIVPVLVLELAAFGSLKDVMDSESELSWLQKCHISMDIAVGLHALHACGFVHGDVKPSNIMIQVHPERQLVAKILDFAGTIDISRYSSGGQQRFRTKLWSAPEILLGSDTVTNGKGAEDVFAFGLLLAHMWRNDEHKEFELESFLEYGIPKYFSLEEKSDMILYYKCCPEDDESSVLKQALKWAQKRLSDPKSRQKSIFLHGILKGSLSPNPRKRASMQHLLKFFEIFAFHSGRKKLSEIIESVQINYKKDKLAKTPKYKLFVHDETFRKRSFEHKGLVLKYMQDSTPLPELSKTVLAFGEDKDYEDIDRLSYLLNLNAKILGSNRTHSDYRWRLTHYEISCCYFYGHGTIIDEQMGLSYLASAALGAVQRAVTTFPALEKSCRQPLMADVPRRLFLVLGFAAGVTQSADLLSNEYPQTFAIMQDLLFHLAWFPGRFERALTTTDNGHLDPGSQNMTESLSSTSEHNMFTERDILAAAIQRERTNVVRQLLNEGVDANTIFDNGATALHTIALITDERASDLATVLLEAGADISAFADEELHSLTSQFYAGKYTPIHWAISKNRPLLFGTLLKWWQNHLDVPADGGMSILTNIVYHRRTEMLKIYVDFLRTVGDVEIEQLSSKKLAGLLRAAVEEIDYTIIDQRWNQGINFRKNRRAITEHLLALGADISISAGTMGALGHAIQEGDGVCMQTMLDYLRCQGNNTNALLNREGMFSEGQTYTVNMSGLHLSLYAVSMEAFDILIRLHPDLVNQATSIGSTPLILAAETGNIYAVESLLQAGANLTASRSETGATALTMALVNGYLSIASMILSSSENPEELLFPKSSDQGSVFDMVLSTFNSGRRHIEPTTFEFLWSNGGVNFNRQDDPKVNVFRCLLAKRRPVLQEDVYQNLELLRLFLQEDIFRCHVNERDFTGRAPIHYAAQYVYPEALELILVAGAHVNLEASDVTDIETGSPWVGWTAIDMALDARTSDIPSYVMAGGASEVRAWQNRVEKALRLLISSGATYGTNAPVAHVLETMKLQDPEGFKRVFISNTNRPLRGDQTWRSKWPQKLPVCSTAKVSDESELIPIWSINDETDLGSAPEDIARRRDMPIIYRTPKGRKLRTTPRFLEKYGATIDVSTSEEEPESTKLEMYGGLEYARSFIALKRREILEATVTTKLNALTVE